MADPETPDPVPHDVFTIQNVCLGPSDITEAIFRQVYRQPLISRHGWSSDEDGGQTFELYLQQGAQLWGLVNYFWPQCTAGADWRPLPPSPAHDHPHVHVFYAQHGQLFRDCLLDPGVLEELVWDLIAADGAERWGHLRRYSEAYTTCWSEHIADLPQLFLADSSRE